MKIKNIIIVGILMLGALTTEAQTIKVDETTASANDEVEIRIMANEDICDYIATGFYIELPEEFSVTGAECAKGLFVKSDHLVRVGQAGENKLRVAVYSLTNSALNLDKNASIGDEGQSDGDSGGRSRIKNTPGADDMGEIPLYLCSLKLKAPNKTGSFTGKLSSIEFATSGHTLVKEEAASFTISVHPAMDVNGDGYLNAKDVIDLTDYMMGKNNISFSAADINGDNVVNIADIIQIINAIMTTE